MPTFGEAGYRELVIEQWLGVFVPSGTAPEIVSRLNAEIGKALGEPAMRERYAQAAMEPVGGTAADMARLLRGDYDKYARLIRDLNIKLD